jgi:hypothetical protein
VLPTFQSVIEEIVCGEPDWTRYGRLAADAGDTRVGNVPAAAQDHTRIGASVTSCLRRSGDSTRGRQMPAGLMATTAGGDSIS